MDIHLRIPNYKSNFILWFEITSYSRKFQIEKPDRILVFFNLKKLLTKRNLPSCLPKLLDFVPPIDLVLIMLYKKFSTGAISEQWEAKFF